MVILAVKPQLMETVLSDIAGRPNFSVTRRKVIISIAAGFRIEKIENLLYHPLDEPDRANMPIIRVMPNTPALVLSGISGISPNRYAGAGDILKTKRILEATGRVVEFEEKELDAVTGVSGSGPAYALYLIEAMAEAGIQEGLDPEKAAILAVATVKGAAELVDQTGESPVALRKKVTSPGGTTEAAFEILKNDNVKQSIINAVSAATKRAWQLSR